MGLSNSIRNDIIDMARLQKLKVPIVVVLSLAFPAQNWAEKLTLRIPITAETPDTAAFYHELLATALKGFGIDADLKKITLPQARIRASLENSTLDLTWMVESEERNNAYSHLTVGLSNGLIGKRILLIRPGEQHKFNDVQTLAVFRNLKLTGAMGKGWFDAKIWSTNNLKYKEQDGNWRSIYPMLAARRVYDYFPRGMNEIVTESKHYRSLRIESPLVLQYERDFRFYLSEKGSKHRETLQRALEQAKSQGLIDRLVHKHWENDFLELEMDTRIVIKLAINF